MMAPAFAIPPQPAVEETLWQATPSPMLLAAHFAGIVLVIIAASVLTMLSRREVTAESEDPGLAVFVWVIACIVLVVQLTALAVAWIRLRSTHYTLTNQRVLIEQGVFTKTVNEIDLRYVDDSLFMQSFLERLVGIGNVTLHSSDKTTPQYVLRAIAEPRKVRETIRTESYKASQRQLFTRET